ncbi:MAG: aminomethyl-transferring glycine dehydrogenase subunit GcvPA [Planctomycetaceae bacterium]|nr:aminomethyl-transferring glycine dehydrogenase subunit GcvPA [Planctomycetaceae bacterium]
MAYIPTTETDRDEMLRAIDCESIEDLFETIPAKFRLDRPLEVPPALTEPELERHVRSLAALNVTAADRTCFLGGGAYDHFIPAAVDEIASRGEFYTAYTPYQPEASQGSLQAFFEFQSLICRLTGMEVSNASLYEGATAASEAAFMSMRVTGRHGNIVVAGSVHPEYRQVLETYLTDFETKLITVPHDGGAVDPNRLADAVTDQTACVLFQHPNFFGCLEQVEELVAAARAKGALAVSIFDPLSLGVLKRPGEYGADIAVAEGQSLGIPLQYGGPYLGLFACREEFVRKMPGRLVGLTTDRNGKPAYVLNLQAREQHIRRGKATSNICTNQGLMALRATVYLSLLGPTGLREVSELCARKAHYAAERLTQVPGLSLAFDRPFFKEFTVRTEEPAATVIARARSAGIDVGPALARFSRQDVTFDLAENAFLVAVTEQRTKAEIDSLVEAISG